jgi:hypothetical protein
MKPKTSDVHIINDLRRVQRHQLHPEPLRVMRLDSGVAPRLIEPAKSLVPERLNHEQV